MKLFVPDGFRLLLHRHSHVRFMLQLAQSIFATDPQKFLQDTVTYIESLGPLGYAYFALVFICPHNMSLLGLLSPALADIPAHLLHGLPLAQSLL